MTKLKFGMLAAVSVALIAGNAAAAVGTSAGASRVAGTIGVRQAVSGVQRVSQPVGQQSNAVGGEAAGIAIGATAAVAFGVYEATRHHHNNSNGVSS